MASSSLAPAAVRRPIAVGATLVVVALALLGLGGCGDSGGDPASSGPRTQAVEALDDFGLTTEQAECVVDALGPDTVVEAGDLNALAEGQAYRDAADDCIADG